MADPILEIALAQLEITLQTDFQAAAHRHTQSLLSTTCLPPFADYQPGHYNRTTLTPAGTGCGNCAGQRAVVPTVSLTIIRPRQPSPIRQCILALLIASIAWPGLRAVCHTHDQFAQGRDSCQRLAEHLDRYHSDRQLGSLVACLDSLFFEWHTHWTITGLTAELPGQPSEQRDTVSAYQSPSQAAGQLQFQIPPLLATLTLEPPPTPALSATLEHFSRTARPAEVSDRIRFCVWTC